MQASQALALERFLEGQELVKKPARLLKGLGAKLIRASDLPASQSGLPAAAPDERFLESLVLSLPVHTLIEVVGRRSSGRFSIGLAAMASSTASGESAALVDLGDNLDPQAAERAGIDLARVLWVRPRRVKEALSAAEMLLATGFRLVVADLGLSPRGGRFVPDAAWVRLQRAARSQESTLLLLVPYRMSGLAADLVVSARAARPFWQGKGPAPRLLTGIASHLILEKRGRETPGRSASLSLSVPEAVSSDHSENFSRDQSRQAHHGASDSPRLADLKLSAQAVATRPGAENFLTQSQAPDPHSEFTSQFSILNSELGGKLMTASRRSCPGLASESAVATRPAPQAES